jgi:hypothetical protein
VFEALDVVEVDDDTDTEVTDEEGIENPEDDVEDSLVDVALTEDVLEREVLVERDVDRDESLFAENEVEVEESLVKEKDVDEERLERDTDELDEGMEKPDDVVEDTELAEMIESELNDVDKEESLVDVCDTEVEETETDTDDSDGIENPEESEDIENDEEDELLGGAQNTGSGVHVPHGKIG